MTRSFLANRRNVSIQHSMDLSLLFSPDCPAFLNHLYGGMDEPEVKIIDVFVCKLRKKLARAGAGGIIGTLWGRGYVIREPAANELFAPQFEPIQGTPPLLPVA
jgi:two-component system cell cycle response regulator CtrA